MLKKSFEEKQIPPFETVSTEYARLSSRYTALTDRQRQVTQELLAVHAQMAEAGPSPTSREERVRALIDDVKLQPAANLQDRVAELARERDDLTTAINEVSTALARERHSASRIIVADFMPEYQAIAADFFTHIAAAAKAHSRYGELCHRFARAGVDLCGLIDFGQDILGVPLKRDDTAGIALRDAVRRGYMPEGALPLEFA